MDLYSKCTKCGKKIDDNAKEERLGYPKTALALLKEGGKIENIELCYACRVKFVEWLKEKDK